ncbi:MAG: response regulator transcription factor, partial [Actinomycetota bacterium]|nr:response regulator transcription factor [Actinomycetota bacterium]
MATNERRRIRVVTVDDQSTYAHGLRTLLPALADDIEVVGVATDAESAMDIVGQLLPDVVLLDIRMPGIDGTEAARKMHEAYPDVCIIMLTILEDPRDVHACMTAGVRGYLSKDVEPEQLIAAIRAVHAGEVVLAPFAASVSFADETQIMPLSDAEIHILHLMGRGCDQGEIARELAVSESTLKRMIHDVQRKLGV